MWLIVVPTKGDTLVVTQRVDLDLAAFFHQHQLQATPAALDEEDAGAEETDERDPVPEMEIQPSEHAD